MVIRYFWVVPFLEVIAVFLLGAVFGFGRTVALLAILSLAGLILFRLAPALTTPRPGKPYSPDDAFLFKVGAFLIMVPGFLSTLAGATLLFRPGRRLCRLLFETKLAPNLPMPLRILASFFGFGASAAPGADSGPGRAWNPYGASETSQDEVVEDDDFDAATAYNGDLSSGGAAPEDDEIIDVDYTVR
ncbi:MAG: FxsA family protein [Thermoguttaceae bacterium]|nr:FxsA family protein [Thermoguttaceae bacterium]